MQKLDYIAKVCEENGFQETVVDALSSDDSPVFVDRHVRRPPGPQMWACEAALALLRKWHLDLKPYPSSLIRSGPLLVVDDSWLAAVPNSPPPHVMVFVARKDGLWEVGLESKKRGIAMEAADCPFGDLIVDYIGSTQVAYVPYDSERELGGCWYIPGERSDFSGQKFRPR